MTGILDRLERGGWIVRERDPSDRRAVIVRASRERYAELLRHYSGMSRSMNKLLADYSDNELELIADFLRRTVDAGARRPKTSPRTRRNTARSEVREGGSCVTSAFRRKQQRGRGRIRVA